MTSFSILDAILKFKEFKLSFEYFWKYYEKWRICSKRSNAPIFHNIFKYMIFQRLQEALLWSKGLRKQD